MLPHMDLWEARNEQTKEIGTSGRQTRTPFPDDSRKQRRTFPQPASPLTENGENALRHRISRPVPRAPLHMGKTRFAVRLDISVLLAIGPKSRNLTN